jgi:hypothetical protein
MRNFYRDTEGTEDISGQQPTSRKVLRDGQLLIERNGEVYTIHGARIEK